MAYYQIVISFANAMMLRITQKVRIFGSFEIGFDAITTTTAIHIITTAD